MVSMQNFRLRRARCTQGYPSCKKFLGPCTKTFFLGMLLDMEYYHNVGSSGCIFFSLFWPGLPKTMSNVGLFRKNFLGALPPNPPPGLRPWTPAAAPSAAQAPPHLGPNWGNYMWCWRGNFPFWKVRWASDTQHFTISREKGSHWTQSNDFQLRLWSLHDSEAM